MNGRSARAIILIENLTFCQRSPLYPSSSVNSKNHPTASGERASCMEVSTTRRSMCIFQTSSAFSTGSIDNRGARVTATYAYNVVRDIVNVARLEPPSSYARALWRFGPSEYAKLAENRVLKFHPIVVDRAEFTATPICARGRQTPPTHVSFLLRIAF